MAMTSIRLLLVVVLMMLMMTIGYVLVDNHEDAWVSKVNRIIIIKSRVNHTTTTTANHTTTTANTTTNAATPRVVDNETQQNDTSQRAAAANDNHHNETKKLQPEPLPHGQNETRTTKSPLWAFCDDHHTFLKTPHLNLDGNNKNKTNNTTTTTLPLKCLEPPPLLGSWQPRHQTTNGTTTPHHSPICCPKNKGPNDPAICRSTGKTPLSFTGNADGSPANMYGRGCQCPHFTDHYQFVHPTWRFDPARTCQLLSNRTVLLVGDSTMFQFGTTLINAVLPGGCQTSFQVVLSDTLVMEPSLGGMNRGTHWYKAWRKHELLPQRPQIVIWGTGAHIQRDADFARVVTSLISTFVQHPQVHFVYKTQQPGGCTPDILSPQDVHAAGLRNAHSPKQEYQHASFYGRDLMVLSLIRQLRERAATTTTTNNTTTTNTTKNATNNNNTNINLHALDLRALYSRSDAHISSQPNPQYGNDCLHYCSPGPLDFVPEAFQDLLEHSIPPPPV